MDKIMEACSPKVISKPEPKWPPASTTAGVKPVSLTGRLHRERERLTGCGMSDEERAWRAQWIRDQRLCDHEPVKVPQLYEKLNNPIKRFCRRPMDKVEQLLVPKLGEDYAKITRTVVGKLGLIIATVYAAAYYFKYNSNDWTRRGGWRVVPNRSSVLPGDPGWPYRPVRTEPSDYADRGFKNSPIQKPLTAPSTSPLTSSSDEQPSPDQLGAADPDGPTIADALEEAKLSNDMFEQSDKVDV